MYSAVAAACRNSVKEMGARGKERAGSIKGHDRSTSGNILRDRRLHPRALRHERLVYGTYREKLCVLVLQQEWGHNLLGLGE